MTSQQLQICFLFLRSCNFIFQCTLCEKAFASVYLLNSHLSTHKEVKDNQCDRCEQRLSCKADLARHYKHKHSSFKPFKCPECECASVESSKLKRHMRTHTGDVLIIICNNIFNSREAVSRLLFVSSVFFLLFKEFEFYWGTVFCAL